VTRDAQRDGDDGTVAEPILGGARADCADTAVNEVSESVLRGLRRLDELIGA
jgi:hypothetical protein